MVFSQVVTTSRFCTQLIILPSKTFFEKWAPWQPTSRSPPVSQALTHPIVSLILIEAFPQIHSSVLGNTNCPYLTSNRVRVILLLLYHLEVLFHLEVLCQKEEGRKGRREPWRAFREAECGLGSFTSAGSLLSSPRCPVHTSPSRGLQIPPSSPICSLSYALLPLFQLCPVQRMPWGWEGGPCTEVGRTWAWTQAVCLISFRCPLAFGGSTEIIGRR